MMQNATKTSRIVDSQRTSHADARRGVALIMVLVLIVMISLGAYSFANLMTAQQGATLTSGRQVQAHAAAISGVEYVKDYLTQTFADQRAVGGHWDNPPYFQNILVSDEAGGQTFFSVIAITQDGYGEPMGIRYGLTDEGSKLNLNVVANSDLYKPKSEDAAGGESGEGNTDGEGGGENAGGDQGDGGQGGSGGGDSPGGGAGADGGAQQGRQAGGAEAGGAGANTGGSSGSQGGTTPTEGEQGETGDLEQPDLQRDALLQLPGMTETIADAILDWIDEDSTPRMFGAEADVYAAMGVEPANGPIHSVDELLLVQGVTPELLFGADRNHNGTLEPAEQEAAIALGGAGGSMSRGWAAYLTVGSKDKMLSVAEFTASGSTEEPPEPIDLNQDDLQALYDALSEKLDADIAMYAVAYRQFGAYQQPSADDPNAEQPVIEALGNRTVDTSASGSKKFESVLDLVGSAVKGKFQGEEEDAIVGSPYDESNVASILLDLMREVTAGEGDSGEGRVNLNQASMPTLMALPEVDDVVAQGIQAGQDPGITSGDDNYLYPTWPLAQGIVTVDQMKSLMPYVSGVGDIFRAQVVGYTDVDGAYARLEVVIDASGDEPLIVSWRDLTHLGPGFDLETLRQAQ